MKQICSVCGEELIPASARWDGESTYVGYMPHQCKLPSALSKPHSDKNVQVSDTTGDDSSTSADQQKKPQSIEEIKERWNKFLKGKQGFTPTDNDKFNWFMRLIEEKDRTIEGLKAKEVFCEHCGDPIEHPICRNCEIQLTLPDTEY